MATTKEMRRALEVLGDDVFGRSVSLRDLDEFDEMYPRFSDVTGPEGPGGDELDLRAGDPDAPPEVFTGDEPEEFERPIEAFPAFTAALNHFEAQAPQSDTVRIDTPSTYSEVDTDGPEVALNLPVVAKGNIKAWQDGDHVVVSVHFEDKKGGHKIASMSAKSKASTAEVKDRVRGLSPFEALGALPEITAQATGQKLVKQVARVAKQAHDDAEVCGMDGSEPLVRRTGEGGNPTLAALMWLQQRAEAGDPQAAAELTIMRNAAETDSGKKIAAPLLAEASRRLAAARAQKVLR